MEKTFNSSDERTVGYGPAYVVHSEAPDFLVGRLLTIIEAVGLPQGQEKAIKDIIRSEVYGTINAPTTVWINGDLTNIIKDFTEWYESADMPRSGNSDTDTPHDYRRGEYTLIFKSK
jgi:hypothetical protein